MTNHYVNNNLSSRSINKTTTILSSGTRFILQFSLNRIMASETITKFSAE
ncbi:hypothetical protein ACFSX9_07760 [Flavobacterium ardleyense]|uniref:Uncharacterized protein n=1 Tax=Flavobacterium ardleyense TaxID=2038737 RepID=A0ABW5Z961_9FLAO